MAKPESSLLAFFFCLALLFTPWANMPRAYGQSPAESRPKVALALGGGGARGVAHIGVLKAFEKEHIPIDFICGTSMGSLVGGLYAAGVSPERLSQMMENGSLARSYDTVPIPFRLALIPIFMIPRACGFHGYEGLYRGRKFAVFLDHAVPESRQRLEGLPIPFHAVCTNLLDGKPYVVTHGSLGTAIQASCAVPALRKPVFIDDRLLCDGAPVANLPVAQAKQMGADIVIAVDVDGPIKLVKPDIFRHIGNEEKRAIDLFLTSVDAPQRQLADLVITPDVSDITVLSTHVKDAKKAIDAGEKAAQEMMPQIRQLLHLPENQQANAVSGNMK